MATNDFKPFAAGAGANVTTQVDWESLPALPTGFTAGKASSAQVNKALRQPSTIAAMVGQFIANANLDALDNGDLDTLVENFTNSLIANLGLGDIAHLSDWSSNFSDGELSQGWRRSPDGLIEQFILVNVTGNGTTPVNVTVNFPIPFPNQVIAIRQSICLTSDPSARFSSITSGSITNSSAGMSFVTPTNNNFYLSVVGR